MSASLALLDARSGQVYLNRTIFSMALDPKHLLEQLRRRGGPRPGGPQDPPNAYLLSMPDGRVRLARGSSCWSSPTTGGGFVQGCAYLVAPTMRFDLPLVAAAPGASLSLHLGVAEPTSVHVLLFDSRGYVIYSDSLTALQDTTWVAPAALPRSAFLAFDVGRKLAPAAPDDDAEYLARFHALP